MKLRPFMTVTAAMITTAAIFLVPPVSVAEVSKTPPASSATVNQEWPGITVSVSGSATISTQGMPPGGEIWGEWYSLPPGQAVVEPVSATKWVYMEMVLDGSAVVTGGPFPMCNAGVRQAGGTDRNADSGDVEVCNYAILPVSRTETGKSDPYIFAGLSVGGPWKEGMEEDIADLYRKAKGVAKAVHIPSLHFSELEEEILKAGEMRLAIRRISLPPGARLVTTDRYPTLRMVENGQLTLSPVQESSDAPAPTVLAAFDTMEWVPANAQKQFALSNTSDHLVQFVEWNVSPVQATTP